MRKLLSQIKRRDLKSVLFKIFIFIIVFSILGYAISLIFPRKDAPYSPSDKPAVNKLTYWKDKKGTVAKDVEFIENTNNYKIVLTQNSKNIKINNKQIFYIWHLSQKRSFK